MAEIKALDTVEFPVTAMNRVSYESIFAINAIEAPQGFYNGVINYSCVFDDDYTWYMRNTTGAAASGDLTHRIISFWLKRHEINVDTIFYNRYINNNNNFRLRLLANNTIEWQDVWGGSYTIQEASPGTLVDCSGWYHIFYKFDSTQAVAANRLLLYINGVDQELTNTTIAQNESSIATYGNSYYTYFNTFGAGGYRGNLTLAEVHELGESTSADVTDFGEFKNGIWIPKAYTGSYGTNGFYYNFSNVADVGEDFSGNNIDCTLFNMTSALSQMPDTPEDNYCTLDFNNKNLTATVYLRYGGTTLVYGNTTWVTAGGTFLMKTGKWYWEIDYGTDANFVSLGIMQQGEGSGDFQIAGDIMPGYPLGFGMLADTGLFRAYYNNTLLAADDNLTGPAAECVICCAFDADANKIWFGEWTSALGMVWGDFGVSGVGDPAAGTNPVFDSSYGIDAQLYDYVPCVSVYDHGTSVCNFGQRAYQGTQPAGFKSLHSSNLSIPLMIQPSTEAFNTVIWDGDSAATKAITGVGFQPDMVLIKERTGGTTNFVLTDSVRGVDLGLYPNGNIVETDQSILGYLQSFDSDGFTLNYGGGTPTYTHRTGYTYVGWCWKMGAAYGFDIQTYTGTGVAHTESHDLGVIPEMIIVKNRTVGGTEWPVYHREGPNKTNPEDYRGIWDEDGGWADSNLFWNDTKPTASVFTVGTHDNVNDNGIGMVAYLWASIPGYSKAFSYTGNGNAAGPYVYLGFRPAFIMYKNAQGTNSWRIYDTVRNPINGVALNALYPDLNNSESTADGVSIDIDSNGFKIRVNSAFINTNNDVFVGIAFAEQPFKYSNAR